VVIYSLLTTFSKVIEKVMHNRISHYFLANNIFFSEQFGFREGISTENAAFKLRVYFQEATANCFRSYLTANKGLKQNNKCQPDVPTQTGEQQTIEYPRGQF
jgi:hypothetical protein